MEKANNNEMDLLIRSLAKGDRGDLSARIGPGGNGAQEVGSHLDADELNAFAEGVVPEAARTRYATHLADCQSCRGIVVNLSQSAGLTIDKPIVKDRRSFWQSLAVIFSPQVMRYAAPALVLTAAIVIGLVAYRRNQTPEFVARHTDSNPAVAVSPTVEQPSQTNLNAAKAPEGRAESRGSTSTVAPAEGPAPPADRQDLARAPGTLDSVTVPPGVATKDGPPPAPPVADTEAAKNQPTYAPEPKPESFGRGRVALSDLNKKAETANPQSGAQVTEQRERNEYKVGAAKEGEDKNVGGLYTISPSGPRRSEEMKERRAAMKSKRDADDETDGIRAVAGRRFRRQGNTWVDTAYESSKGATSMSRGSEQFRVLVADEPAIRTIANQLEGEVIVVWKGRAYRIH